MKTSLAVAIIALSGAASATAVTFAMRPAAPAETAYVPPAAPAEIAYTITPAMDLPPRTQKEPEAPAAPAAPAAAYSSRTAITALLGVPAVREVIFRDLPVLAQVSQAQLDMAGPMSLRTAQSMLPNILTDAALDKLDQDLAKIPAQPATVAPTAAAAPAPAVAPSAPQVAAAAPATGFSSRSTVSALLGNPAARDILMRDIPALAQAPQAQLNLAAAMSPRDVQRLMPTVFTDAALNKLDQDLTALPAGGAIATAPAAPASAPAPVAVAAQPGA